MRCAGSALGRSVLQLIRNVAVAKRRTEIFPDECLLLALNGRRCCRSACPLSGVKRTSLVRSLMSANDPKQTFRLRIAAALCASVATEEVDWAIVDRA